MEGFRLQQTSKIYISATLLLYKTKAISILDNVQLSIKKYDEPVLQSHIK